jgi:hypothetical protein
MIEGSYAAYLFSWIPSSERWDWHDLRGFRRRWLQNASITEDWSSGRSKSIPINARVFLIKQGDPPRGIFASGRTASPSLRKFNGNYSALCFDTFLDPEMDGLLAVEGLHDLSKTIWHNQMSGVGLAPDIAAELERQWKRFLDRLGTRPRSIPYMLPVARLVPPTKEGRLKLAIHYRRERNSGIAKEKKLAVFAKEGRLKCEACGFNFCEAYGKFAEGVCECHHEKALKRGERWTRLDDLHIVCANCHRAIHCCEPMLTLAGLRRIVERQARRPD